MCSAVWFTLLNTAHGDFLEKLLDLEDSATQTYRYVDEGARSMFELACEVTEPREAVSPTPQRTQAPESKAGAVLLQAPESRW